MVRLNRLRMDELVNAWVGGRTTPFQMGLLAVFEAGPFAGADGSVDVDVDVVARELAKRTSRVPELRRRVLWTHLGEGRPVWVEDQDDLGEQVVTAGPAPGPDLATWAANRTIQPLRRDRPLWRAHVVAGLPGGRFAVLLVVHHLLADGLAGMRLLASLLDADADAARSDPPPRSPNPLPSHRELLSDNLRSRRRSGPRRRAHRRSPRAGAGRAIAQYREATSDLSRPLPRTSLPRVVGPSRRMSVAAAPLQPLRAAAHAQKATINDLLLEAVTHGLRDLLTARGECRESMFVRTIVPVALDHSRQAASLMVVDLPVGDPTRRADSPPSPSGPGPARPTCGPPTARRQTCCRCRSRSPGCSFPGPADVAAPESTCPSPTCPGHRPRSGSPGPGSSRPSPSRPSCRWSA